MSFVSGTIWITAQQRRHALYTNCTHTVLRQFSSCS